MFERRERLIRVRQKYSSLRTWLGDHPLIAQALPCLGLALLVLVMFADLLFSGGDRMVSHPSRDIIGQFVAWRTFGFDQMAAGNLPLWNPYIYSGVPFAAGFQAALFYPPNLLFLLLPLPVAINWSVALHLILLGWFMHFWALRRGLRPVAGFVIGALAMFSGPVFPHVFAGHLPNLCAMPWVPLLLLAIDAWLDKSRPVWLLVAILAVALQILSGHVQYVYYTALTAGLYSLFRLVSTRPRARLAIGLLTIHPGAVLLAAVQLLPALAISDEITRGQGLPYEAAAMFSFPPENLLTLLVPGFFGGGAGLAYWGRCHLWEMSLFIGVGGLLLALLGITSKRPVALRADLPMAALLMILALGCHTPAFKWLYSWLPGFDSFRGTAKFGFEAILFVLMLAGAGLDRLWQSPRNGVRFPTVILVLGAACLGAGFWLRAHAEGGESIRPLIQFILASGEAYQSMDDALATLAARRAGNSLAMGGIALGMCAGALLASRRWTGARWIIPVMALFEVFGFGLRWRDTCEISAARPPEIMQFLAEHPGDYRIFNLFASPNNGTVVRRSDIWGDDPVMLRRYAEFIKHTQGLDPNADQYDLRSFALHPLHAMLRLKYVFVREPTGSLRVEETLQPLGQLEIVGDFAVIRDRDEILRTISDPLFDPRRRVILESPPQPSPRQVDDAGTARVIESGTDFLHIEAEVKSPAILLITDSYGEDWRARALPGSTQAHYQLMPANYVLRAIPLQAGHHRIRVEYAPASFRNGAIVSGLAILVWLAAFMRWRRPKVAD